MLKLRSKILHLIVFFLALFYLSAAEVHAQKSKDIETDSLSAKGKNTFFYFDYTVKPGDTYAKILKRFVKEDSIITANTPMIIKTRNKNPHMKNWAKLKNGQTFRLYISSNFLNKKAVKKYFKNKKPKSWNHPLFYMASLGTFTQEFDQGTVLNFHQNSPISIGTAYSYYPKRKNYSYSSSLYLSTLKAAIGEIDGVSTNVDVPIEIGGNVYFDYKMNGKNFNLYGGLDFERFSTFNKDRLLEDGLLSMDKNFVTYLTAGWSSVLTVWKWNVFTKISVSKSITSSQSNDDGAKLAAKPYDGFKFMLYFNYRVKGPWFVHLLYKVHMMEGPDKLSTNRTGIGFGYNFK